MKKRLSVTVDAELIAAGRAAVESGRYENLSAWVGAALRERSERDRLLRAGDEFFRWYEAEYGDITEEDMERAERELSARAIRVNWPEQGQDEDGESATPRRSAPRSA
jgi:Arc/MetJ-type ribon-helix-helix transcriptional regulator